MRINPQALGVVGFPLAIDLGPARRPECNPAERLFEVIDGLHRHRIDHLLMELRIGLGWRDSRLREDVAIVEVGRSVTALTRRIDIDDLDVFSNRTWLET